MRFFPIIAVVGGFATMGYPQPAPAPAPAPLALSAALQECDDEELQEAAMNALLQMESERAMPILVKVLERRDECSLKLRRKAVFVVAQQEIEGTEEILLRVARTDPDEGVREQAVFWLSQVPGDGAVSALDSILMGSEVRAIQEKAIFALAQHESSRAHQILRDYVERADQPVELREKAIFWLGNEGSAADQAYLRELYSRIESRTLKEKIIFAAAQSDAAENRDWLLAVAGDANETMEVRKRALFWVAQRDDVSVADLKALYDGAAEPEIKRQVLFGLSQRDESQAVDQLMEIARSETDVDLRRKAVFWLGQTDDPRAAEFLLQIINQEVQ